MALKITTQIGTDQGITSEAYVRITNYELNKFGSASFRIELFQSEEEIVAGAEFGMRSYGNTARNQQIGEYLYVALTKEVEETITRTRTVNVPVVTEEEQTIVDAEGNTVTNMVEVTNYELREEEYEETITKTVPDLSSAEEVNIFAFGYSHLKTKLVGLFGEANVIDC